MPKQLTIRQLLLLAFLLAGLLPAMLVSFLSFYQARNALKKEITQDMQTHAQAIANDVARTMTERMHNVQTWSQLELMQELQIGDVDKRLSNFLQELKQNYGGIYSDIEVINLDQTIIASSNPQHVGSKATSLPVWFETRINHSPISLSTMHQDTLAISHEITDHQTQERVGYLIAYFNWQVVQALLANAVVPPSAAAVLDQNHRLIAQTPNWLKVKGSHEMSVTGLLPQSAALPQWQVQLQKAHSVAVAPVHRLGYVFVALLLATLLLAAIIVKPIASAITRPLEALRQFVQKAKPARDVKAPGGGPPEVQALSAAFETMLHDLDNSQQQLTRAAKLAVVGEMAAAMSHEVRTPLGILRSSANLLQREPKLSKEGHEVVGFIVSETERLNGLVSSLIDAARPRPPNFKPLDIAALATQIIAMLRPQTETKHINIQLTALEASIEADSGQMTQVLMNLLQNAVQILPLNGQIEVHIAPHDQQVEIRVDDNGPGIPPENQQHIFEPFFTQRAGGVGLGLAVVRQIIQAHHGTISYSASHLGGARFTILLPLLQTSI
jgi:signal transduction histidine kinase